MVGIRHFFDELSYKEEREDAKRLYQAKKSNSQGHNVLAENIRVIWQHQQHLSGHFLRRTTSSVDYNGIPLLDLPPYQEIVGLLKLTEREMAIITEHAEAAKCHAPAIPCDYLTSSLTHFLLFPPL